MSDLARDDHQPGIVDDEGHTRCDCCGFRWPCPDIRNQPRQLDTDEYVVLRALDITIGSQIWKRLPDGADHDPPGGLVIGIYDNDGATIYHCINWRRQQPRYCEIALLDVEPATVALPNTSSARRMARQLAAHVGKQKGVSDGGEIQLLADAITLLRSVT